MFPVRPARLGLPLRIPPAGIKFPALGAAVESGGRKKRGKKMEDGGRLIKLIFVRPFGSGCKQLQGRHFVRPSREGRPLVPPSYPPPPPRSRLRPLQINLDLGAPPQIKCKRNKRPGGSIWRPTPRSI